MLIAVNGTKVSKVKVIYQGETPGLGTLIENDRFLDQFVGKDRQSAKLKVDGGEIDALTGATISSRAVAGSVSGVLN
jgi:electron transport complex protein RnfG